MSLIAPKHNGRKVMGHLPGLGILRRFVFMWPLLGALTLLFLTLGCKTSQVEDITMPPSYQPSNVFRAQDRLPEKLRRIAILPITPTTVDAISESGRDTLQPVLLSELGKTKAFELVNLPMDQARQLGWPMPGSESDKVPATFFKQLRENTGCDGVLIARLTTYRPYTPVAVGWNIKLIDCQDARVYWSVDELFDSGNAAVASGARRYFSAHLAQAQSLSDSVSILSSPRRFGQYTLYTLFSTLPLR